MNILINNCVDDVQQITYTEEDFLEEECFLDRERLEAARKKSREDHKRYTAENMEKLSSDMRSVIKTLRASGTDEALLMKLVMLQWEIQDAAFYLKEEWR